MVAVGVVLATLLGFGVLRWPTAPSPNVASGFETARADAREAAQGYAGLNWTLWWAVGFVPSSAVTLPVNYTYVALVRAGCSFTTLTTAEREVPGSSNVSQGSTSAWVFGFSDGGSEFLLVSAVAGVTALAGTVNGTTCPDQPPAGAAFPDSAIDPTFASVTAAHAGGTAFLSGHPNANVTLTGVNHLVGAGLLGAQWIVTYSDCPAVTSLQLSGSFFSATVNASTGFLEAASNYTGSCPWVGEVATTPLNLELAVTNAFVASAGSTFWYNFTVRLVVVPMTLGELGFALEGSSGLPLNIPNIDLSVVGLSGSVLGTFDLTSGAWTAGSGASLTAGCVVVLSSPVDLSGQGNWLNVTGRGVFSGSVSLAIP